MHDDDADTRHEQSPDDQPAADNGVDDAANSDDLVELVSSPPRRLGRFRRRPERQSANPAENSAEISGRTTVFTVENIPDRSMTFRLSGAQVAHGARIAGWQVDFGTLNVQMNDLGRFIAMYHRTDDDVGRATWRSTALEIGTHLYQGLLNADQTLARHLLAARRRVRATSNLTLTFAGPRDYLSVPYELLHDGRMPLAVRYPLCRQMTGVERAPGAGWHAVVERLRVAGEPLRILLISSGDWLVGADDEIDVLYPLITAAAGRTGLPVQVDVLATGRLSREAIRAALRQPYHLIHYAGQVYHDRTHDAQSGFLFGGADEPRTGQLLITVQELRDWLPPGSPHFFYISACMGPQDWDELVLVDSDYLGLIGELVRGGVPNVLGFRWHVTNAGRLRFAQHFYENVLTAPCVPEYAVLKAREAIYYADAQDETWLSPVLVVQHVYEGGR